MDCRYCIVDGAKPIRIAAFTIRIKIGADEVMVGVCDPCATAKRLDRGKIVPIGVSRPEEVKEDRLESAESAASPESRWKGFIDRVEKLRVGEWADFRSLLQNRKAWQDQLRDVLEKTPGTRRMQWALEDSGESHVRVTRMPDAEQAVATGERCRCGKELRHKGRCPGVKNHSYLDDVKPMAPKPKISVKPPIAENPAKQDPPKIPVPEKQVAVPEVFGGLQEIISDQINDDLNQGKSVQFWGRPVNGDFLDTIWLNLTGEAKARILEHISDVMFPPQVECPGCKKQFVPAERK